MILGNATRRVEWRHIRRITTLSGMEQERAATIDNPLPPLPKLAEDGVVLTLKEAAALLRMPYFTACQLARDGKFPGQLESLVARRYRVSAPRLYQWVLTGADQAATPAATGN